MGGDYGAKVVIPGLAVALKRQPELKFLLFGDEKVVNPLLAEYGEVAAASKFVHTDIAIKMDEKPSQAVRRGRHGASMWLAIQAVKNNEAAVAISAGNTGALMFMAKIAFRTMKGISRPAMTAIWPTSRGQSIVLDVGANVGADARQLVEFAIMGEDMARAIFGIEKPTVGLLNVGVEEIKGIEYVKEAGRMLRKSNLPIEYVGFVEGTDIGKGTVDVVVTEGFTGNIALKTAEGTARQIAAYMKEAIEGSFISKIGYMLSKPAFRIVRNRLDPRNNNGGVLLGLNGLVVKSHGGTDEIGFASAVGVASNMAKSKLVEKIAADIINLEIPDLEENNKNAS